MTKIETSVAQVRDIMGEIAAATDEQSRGISQIAQAMAEMDTTTQQNAALVEESSAAASSLEEQAVQLENVVSIFRVSKDTTSRTEPRRVSARTRLVCRSAQDQRQTTRMTGSNSDHFSSSSGYVPATFHQQASYDYFNQAHSATVLRHRRALVPRVCHYSGRHTA
jgi:uncharacterized phage infection (PIP) family protein YhgE